MSKVFFEARWGLQLLTRKEINVGQSVPSGLPLHARSGSPVRLVLDLCHGVFLRECRGHG